ncbi:flagellar filament capping protein FliD [Marinobacter salinisoli]|uniref:Flagellar hook-associated protein 2 n=1 Tax=Marinobacter salinisoli TaxID=2769486 RepID=A0ABX7MQ48_9GAMM|nr:flagellar filament capping protein FliD [Marinobacter salinisoli]QSP94452.1 flagellar filament capping protein FliD [Marinobacter salinisoli]
MAGISSLGVGSGIFSADLVDQLVNAERQPAELRLNRREGEAQAKISAFGALRSALEAMKSPLEALAEPEGLKALSATSSNESTAAVSVDSAVASRGSYSVNVTQLAQAQSLASGVFADSDSTTVGEGTMTFTVNGVSTDITVDSSNNTLQGLADSINDANAGLSAGVVDTGSGFRLVLSADDTGLQNAIQVSVTDADGNNADMAGLSQFAFDGAASNLAETVAAKDALLEVNGIAVSRPTNSIEGVVAGVTFDVAAIGSTNISVERDADAVAERVREFVDKYNELEKVIGKYAGFNSVSGSGGMLTGDSTIRNMERDIRAGLTTIPAGLETSSVRSLADLGIKTDPATGKLEFDDAIFKEKLEADPAAVTAIFAGQSGGEGISDKISQSIESYVGSDGLFSTRTEGLNKTLDQIRDQRDRLDIRMQSYRERLVSQFTAADSLISQLNSTGNYVSQQLAAIAPQPSSRNS